MTGFLNSRKVGKKIFQKILVVIPFIKEMATEEFCSYCQQWNVDHQTPWCPQIICRKCGKNGHTILHCMVNFQTFPFPDEIILKIFGYLCSFELGNCAQVSKRWRRITLDRKLHCRSFQGKVNSVQEACAKCFAVHILNFEILQTT